MLDCVSARSIIAASGCHRDRQGAIAADQVIVTTPSALIAAEQRLFYAGAAGKDEAAQGLPLGLPTNCSWRSKAPRNSTRTSASSAIPIGRRPAAYQFRPFGRPMIEVYFGEALPRSLRRAATGHSSISRCPILSACLAARSPARQADRYSSLGRRSVFARLLFVCIARLCRLPAETRRAVDARLFFAGEACSAATSRRRMAAGMTACAPPKR